MTEKIKCLSIKKCDLKKSPKIKKIKPCFYTSRNEKEQDKPKVSRRKE